MVNKPIKTTVWKATQAKAHFSGLLDKTEYEGPQTVQRRKKCFLRVDEATHQVRARSAAAAAEGGAGAKCVDVRRTPKAARIDFDLHRRDWEPRKRRLF